MTPTVHTALQYFTELNTTLQTLDAEGKEMLPDELGSRIYYLGDSARQLWSRMCNADPEDFRSLQGLIAAAK